MGSVSLKGPCDHTTQAESSALTATLRSLLQSRTASSLILSIEGHAQASHIDIQSSAYSLVCERASTLENYNRNFFTNDARLTRV